MKNCDKVKIQCLHCQQILQPDCVGTFIRCRCGKCAVDGKFDKQGEGYVRLIGNTGDYRVIK